MNPDELDAAWLRLADIRRRLANLRAELVTREPTFAELLERSSLGTRGAMALRSRTTPEEIASIRDLRRKLR